jgi:hypothetical protein
VRADPGNFGLACGESALQFDMPELVDRTLLPENATDKIDPPSP